MSDVMVVSVFLSTIGVLVTLLTMSAGRLSSNPVSAAAPARGVIRSAGPLRAGDAAVKGMASALWRGV